MKFNETRAIAVLNIPKPKSTCERIEINYPELKALALLGLVDPENTQNNSPTISEFLEFYENNQCSEEEVIYEAYIVTGREDARVSVEGIRLNTSLSSEKTKRNFINNFHHADEFEVTEETYRAWWD